MSKFFWAAAAAWLVVGTAWAQGSDADAGEAPVSAAWQAAATAMQHGPTDIPLVDQAVMHLPAGYGFVPRREAAAVMAELGNRIGDSFIGLVFPSPANDKNWFATLNFTDEGHIKDDDAKNWDQKALYDNLRDGTEAGNEFRKKRGITPIELTGWVEAPHYDATAHRLIWSVGAKDKGAADDGTGTVNYNTYVLGREGYISLDFITSKQTIEAQKPEAQTLLAAIDFKTGRRYEDFMASTDRLAAYGIAALVGGAVLKKAGLLAVIGAFILKFAKVILLAAAGVFTPLYRKFFKRKTE